jgi:hypothetical protein
LIKYGALLSKKIFVLYELGHRFLKPTKVYTM